MTMDSFQQLFTTDNVVKPQDIIDLIEPSITAQTDADLRKEFSDEEIGDALFQIGPLKAPALDDLPGRFFSAKLGSFERGCYSCCQGILLNKNHVRRCK